MNRRIIISGVATLLFLLIGCVLFSFFFSFRKPPERSQKHFEPISVTVLKLAQKSYREKISGYGVTRSLMNTQVEPEVAGLVVWISKNLESGKLVKKKEELVRLDARDYHNAVQTAHTLIQQAKSQRQAIQLEMENLEAQIKLTKQQLTTSTKELTRLQNLAGNQQLSQSQADQQLLQTLIVKKTLLILEFKKKSQAPALSNIESIIKQRTIQWQQAQDNLSRTVIKAPYQGTIEKRYVQLGSRVSPGVKLFQIVSSDQIEIPIMLAASYFQSIQSGSEVCLRKQRKGKIIWKGQISRVSAVIDENSRTFCAYVSIPPQNVTPELAPGSFVYADLSGKLYPNILVVPRSAMMDEQVLVAERKTKIGQLAVANRKRPVILKMLRDVALVQGGLSPGDEIILTNLEEIGNKSTVSISATVTTEDLHIGDH